MLLPSTSELVVRMGWGLKGSNLAVKESRSDVFHGFPLHTVSQPGRPTMLGFNDVHPLIYPSLHLQVALQGKLNGSANGF